MNKLFMLALATAVMTGPLAQAQRGNRDAGRSGPQPFGPNAQYYTPQPRTVPSLPAGCVLVTVGGEAYYYGAGLYYRSGAGGYMVVPTPSGAAVTSLPPGAQQVLVGDTLGYVVNGVTYRKTVNGYEVMPPPAPVVQQVVTAAPPAVVAEPPPALSAPTNDVFTVNIPNAKGGFTPILLKRSGKHFIGPQGELYTEFPRVEQLKLQYGK
jgi:hypothetical protein